MSDTKRKISAWIPAALYDDIEKAGYTSPTIAVTKGLELLVRTHARDIPETSGHKAETIGDNWETSRRQLETERENLKNEIEKLKASLQGAPDPVELAQLCTRSEELEKHNDTLLKELKRNDEHQQNRIEDLKNHIYSLDNQLRTKDDQLEKLNENMHKQAVHLQTLLNQKTIEALGNKKAWYKFW